MAIKKLDDGRYELDTRTGGRGSKRVRRIFNRKADAVAYEKYMLGKLGAMNGRLSLKLTGGLLAKYLNSGISATGKR